MKYLKIFSTLLFACFLTSTFAQTNPEQRIEKRIAYLTEELNLSPTQVDQIRALEAQRITERKAKKEEYKTKHVQKVDVIKEELAEVLSPEQMRELEAYHAEKKAQRKAEKKAGDKKPKMDRAERRKEKGAQHFEELSQRLSLTDEQKPKVKAILKNAKQGHKAKRSNAKTQIKLKKAQYKAELAKILSPEQLQKLQTLKEEKKGKRRGKQ